MTNDLKNLSEKNQAFLLTCAMRDGEKAVALLDYVVDAPVEKLRAILSDLAKVPKPQLKKEHWEGLTGVRGGKARKPSWNTRKPVGFWRISRMSRPGSWPG